MKKYAYYLGCTIPFRESNYDLSTRKVMGNLDVELVDLKGAGCCGLYYEQINELTHLAMSARVISMAESLGLDLMVLCNGCNGSLVKARNKLVENPELRDKVNEILADIDREFRGTSEIKHVIRILYEDIGIDEIKKTVKNPLNVKVAAHYGCHLLKPSEQIKFDDPREPKSLDELIEVTGAKSVDYFDKNLCCGGFVLGADKDIAYNMTGQKLQNVKDVGADLMITACPFCHVMYDANQRAIENELQKKFGIPVLHYPQLLGLAMGFNARDLALEQNRVRVNPGIFDSWGQ